MNKDIKEEWQSIPDFYGYEASNLGRIRKVGYRTKIISQYIDTRGYYACSLWRDFKYNVQKAHRLIASAFIPNPDNKPFINHKDCNKLNNLPENLEWCTQQENVIHAISNNRRKSFALSESTKKMVAERSKKAVVAYNAFTEKQEFFFESVNECAKHFGVSQSTISSAIRRNSIVKGSCRVKLAIDKTKMSTPAKVDDKKGGGIIK